jgi:hypothetical protein
VPETASAATDLDLISYLQAIPDARMRRGVSIPAWYLLLVAVFGILSGCQSLRNLERFARRHHAALTKSLGLELRRPPSDSAFCYFFLQVDVAALCTAIRDWTIAQIPCGATELDQLICDGKTLRGSIEPTPGGGSAFIAQVTLYSAALGLAISQAYYATSENHERAVLKQLLGELDLEGVLIQADALHTIPSARFSTAQGAGGRLPTDGVAGGFSEGVSQSKDTASPDQEPVPGEAPHPRRGKCFRGGPWSCHHLDAPRQTGTGAHPRDLERHQLDRGSDRDRHPRRQAVQSHAPIPHQLANHPRSPAATGAGPLEH